MRHIIPIALVGLLVSSVIAGCATTTTETIDLRATKLLVIGLVADAGIRKKFENALAGKLNARGIRSIPSQALLPVLTSGARESVAQLARENDVTAVVAVAPVSVDDAGRVTDRGAIPMERHEQLDAFLRSTLVSQSPEGQVALVTNVYQVSTGRLLWGGVSWSFQLEDVDELIDETSSMIADNIVTAQRQLLRLRSRGIDPLGTVTP